MCFFITKIQPSPPHQAENSLREYDIEAWKESILHLHIEHDYDND
jgi:hypothetical protein